jgi:hypothetical protein
MSGENTGNKSNPAEAQLSGIRLIKGSGLKGLAEPVVEGEIILNRQPVSFLGDFDVETGQSTNPDHDIVERSISGKIFVFPSGVGSTVGSHSLINMSMNEAGPKAILVNHSDPIILLGCCVANIPHIHRFQDDIIEMLEDGMKVKVDSERGVVEVLD